MCDPSVLAIGSAVAGLAGTAANSIGASNAADEQRQAYDSWAAEQKRNRAAAAAKDEADRKMADTARAQGLQDVSATNQKSEQQQEQDRLTAYLQGDPNSPASNETSAAPQGAVSDANLVNNSGGDAVFKNDLTTKLNQASTDAKARIAALAAVGSYGGSSGGLDVKNANAFQRAGEGIDLANEFRKGDLATYGIQKDINPLQYTYTKSPLADLSAIALSSGSQGLGKMLASRIG